MAKPTAIKTTIVTLALVEDEARTLRDVLSMTGHDVLDRLGLVGTLDALEEVFGYEDYRQFDAEILFSDEVTDAVVGGDGGADAVEDVAGICVDVDLDEVPGLPPPTAIIRVGDLVTWGSCARGLPVTRIVRDGVYVGAPDHCGGSEYFVVWGNDEYYLRRAANEYAPGKDGERASGLKSWAAYDLRSVDRPCD